MDVSSFTSPQHPSAQGGLRLASEEANGKRSVSKAQARKLAEFFHVNVELFI
jgi:hypothetical protein